MTAKTDRRLRAYACGIEHESNSFSPIPTTLQSFERDLLYRPGDDRAFARAADSPAYGDSLKAAAAHGIDVVAGTFAWAQPSGPVAAEVYQALRDTILRELRAAGPLDMVLVTLHGAMMAEGCEDCEADLLAHVRECVGPNVPIGALLDLHGNLSPEMLASNAVLIACKEYPHIDYRQRADELVAILVQACTGQISPASVMCRVPMLGLFGTTEDPMKAFVARLKQAEADGILSVSAWHGFPWSDMASTGAAIQVVYDARRTGLAARAAGLARSLADEFFSLGTASPARGLSVDEALDAAANLISRKGPVVIADTADNPGGGAASDSTFILHRLLERGIRDVAAGMFWDPGAVAAAMRAGVGAKLPLSVGGKVGPLSGSPVQGEWEVLAIRSDACQRGLDGHALDALGDAVALRLNGVEVVVNAWRQQTFSPDCFTQLGIDLSKKVMVVVKSTQHFRHGFDPIAATTIYCDAPGTLNLDLAQLPYRRVRRPLWPLDALDLARKSMT